MSHTKGQWEAFKTNIGFHIEANETPIADVHLTRVNFSNPDAWNHEQAEANARLIAAAPEMLAALKLAKNALMLNGLCVPGKCDKTADAINAAIAKAKGES